MVKAIQNEKERKMKKFYPNFMNRFFIKFGMLLNKEIWENFQVLNYYMQRVLWRDIVRPSFCIGMLKDFAKFKKNWINLIIVF